jgi:transposase-like protein
MKIDGLHIPKKYDRRVKLSDKDKKQIAEAYATGGTSYNKLASEYGVSKRTIYWVVNPEKQRENYELRKANGGSKQYYSKEKNTQSMRNHREYKKELLEEGKLEK